MDALAFNNTILAPGLAAFQKIVPAIPVTRNVQVLLLAIAGQEAAWTHRIQSGNGPAHGFWQFERAGGVKGVLTHPLTDDLARTLAVAAGVAPTPEGVWGKMAAISGDNLAVGFARLLLWTDPRPVPDPTKESVCLNYYLRNWRPGKPHPDAWPVNIRAANKAVPV